MASNNYCVEEGSYVAKSAPSNFKKSAKSINN